jgi:anti-sigma-K factor RskA
MSHDEASELLGAYALDAVDGEEFTELEEHLAGCPRCRAELDGLREVAAALGNTVETPPEGLWSGIASRLPERDEEAEARPMPPLESEERSPFRAPAPGRRQRRGVVATVVGFAVAAAAVAAVLGIGLVRADDKVDNLQSSAAHPPSAATLALRAPGHRMVALASSTGVTLADFVVLPDGRGYLVTSTLPSLGAGHTYQLWGTVGSKPISLGLLGPVPRQATFTMAGSVQPTRLSITAEPAGGTVAPTGAIVATGTV